MQNQSICLPRYKPKRKKTEKPKPFAHNSDVHSSNLEVELTDLPEDSSSRGRRSGDSMSSVVDEGCMGEGEVEEDFWAWLRQTVLGEAVVYSNQSLPILITRKEEVDVLIAQQKADVCLAELRRKTEKCEDGYLWEDGVLVHLKQVNHGREWTLVVVPFCRCREVIDLGHRGLARGHYSHNKMMASLTQHFTWPGLRKNVKSTVAAARNARKQTDSSNQKPC